MSSDPVMQVLGRIEGKLDSEIELAKEHRDDDKRRFGEVYIKLGEHDQEIASAKGAKAALLWAAGLVAGVVTFVGPAIAKALGWK